MDAGPHAKRGFRFEAEVLLNYALLRLLEGKGPFAMYLESGQDATLIYEAQTGQPQPPPELIQCKKKEARPPEAGSAAVAADPWAPGDWAADDLKKMLESPTGGAPIVQQLVGGAHLTLLLFGLLSKSVAKFAPPGLVSYGYMPDYALFLKAFPADFVHTADPDSKRKVGPAGAVKQIRVAPMAAPGQLRSISRNIIEGVPFKVSPAKAAIILPNLFSRFEAGLQRLSTGDQSARVITSDEILQALSQGRRGAGAWTDGREWIGRPRRLNRSEATSLSDADQFRVGRYWKNEYFVRAEEILSADRSLVITGPICSGKSTLCNYLIFKFLEAHPGAAAYHLAVRSGMSLAEEVEFFENNADLPTLFVIDDEQNSSNESAAIARAFLEKSTKSYLLVTSSQTYSTTQFNRNDHPLNEFPSVTLEDFASEQIGDLLGCGLPGASSLNAKQIDFVKNVREVSSGRIGLALVAARAFDKKPTAAATLRRLDAWPAMAAICDLICDALDVTVDQFDKRILSILLITSLGVGIPKNFDAEIIAKLDEIGLLRAIPTARGERYISDDPSFSVVLARQHRGSLTDRIAAYLQQEPDELVDICCSLANHGTGRNILADIMARPEIDLASVLRGRLQVSRAEFSACLGAMARVSRDHARKILRKVLAPNGQVDPECAELMFALHDAHPIATARQLLETTRTLDRSLVRQILNDAFGERAIRPAAEETVRTIHLNLRPQHVGLAEALSFILTVRRCHLALGEELFHRFQVDELLVGKLDVLLPLTTLSIGAFVDALDPLRRLNNEAFSQVTTRILDVERFAAVVLSFTDGRAALRIFRSLRKAHPRFAIELAWRLWRERRGWFTTLLGRTRDVVDAVGLLGSIGRIDRRIALQFASAESARFCAAAAAARDPNRLASAIFIVHGLAPDLAAQMAEQINPVDLAKHMNLEQHRLQLVGRSLSGYALVRPSLTVEVLSNLDLDALYGRLGGRAYLYTFVSLTRGVLDAKLCCANIDRYKEIKSFVVWLRSNENLSERLRDLLNPESDAVQPQLREIAFAFSELLSVGMPAETIFFLFGIPNPATLRERVRHWVEKARDLESVRQVLYALILLPDRSQSRAALNALIALVRARHQSGDARTTDGLGERDKPRPPKLLESTDIVEIGDLLRLAAAIDDGLAVELAEAFYGRLLENCRRDNLGRQAVLLQGLHAASRRLSRAIVVSLYGPDADKDRLIDMINESESIDSINGLVHQVQEIDRATARHLLKVALDTSRERLLALAGVDANLHSTSRWLRTMHRQSAAGTDGLQEEVFAVMLTLREYDSRLFSAVEAVVALIDVGHPEKTHLFVADVVKYARQAGSVRSIGAFTDLCLLLMRIDQALGTTCLLTVVRQLSNAEVARLLSLWDEPVAAAFFHWLAQRYIPQLKDQRESDFAQARADIVLPPVEEMLGLVGRILLDRPGDAIGAAVDGLSQDNLRAWRPWEVGLVETVWLVSQDSPSQALIDPQAFWSGLNADEYDALNSARTISFGPDATNIKFALALRSKVDCVSEGPPYAQLAEEAERRRTSEARSVVRLLLDPTYLAAELAGYPYYFKALLESSTFLRQRFDWANRVATEIHRSIFEPAR